MKRLLAVALALLLLGAGKIPVTVMEAKVRTLEIWTQAVGEVKPRHAPWVSAEVGGRIQSVHGEVGQRVRREEVLAEIDPEDYRMQKAQAQAEVERLKALLHGQGLQVNRLKALVSRKLADQSALDDAMAQLKALKAQLDAARARLDLADRALEKTRILAPIDGIIDERKVSAGDFVDKGTPLFRIVDPRKLEIWLPFPEALKGKLKPGLLAVLETPASPERIQASITALRPAVHDQNRAVFARIALPLPVSGERPAASGSPCLSPLAARCSLLGINPGTWMPGASVTARVRLEVLEGAVVVPEVSVIKRPSGDVVYVIEGGHAKARQVKTGVRQGGWVAILKGLSGGEVVAVDGAGFLTDGALVEVH